MPKIPVYIPEEGDGRLVKFSVEVPMVVKRKVEALFTSFGYEDWEQWLDSVSDTVISEIDNDLMISITTAQRLVPEWTRNISENIADVKVGNGILDLRDKVRKG